MGAWSLSMIILSRIHSILLSGQEFESINFDDVFNMLREINEHNYQFIKHQLPKILYQETSP